MANHEAFAGDERFGVLPRAREEQRSRRELLRHRLNLVKTRTEVKNRIHGLLDKHGLRMPGTTAFSKENIVWLRGLSLGFMDDARAMVSMRELKVPTSITINIGHKCECLIRSCGVWKVRVLI